MGKWGFSKGVRPWFLSKKEKFFNLFNLGKTGQENVLDDILERKKASLDYKTTTKKKWKIWEFSKGVSPWFWSKNCNFSIFLFWASWARKMSLTIF